MVAHLWSIGEAHRSKAVAAKSETLGYVAGLVAWLFGAGVFVAVRGTSNEMPSWTFCFWRIFLAVVLMLPIVWRHRSEMARFVGERGLEAFLIGALGIGITQGLIFKALSLTTAVNAGIIFSTAPIITLLVAGVVLHEPVGVRRLLGVLFAFSGIVVIAVQGSVTLLLSLGFGIGDLFVIVAAFTFAGYTVSLKRAKFELDRLPLLVILMMSGAIALLPFFVYEIITGAHEDITVKGYLALGFAVTFGGVLLYLLYNLSIDALGASRAGALVYSQMVFTTILAWLILGETIAWYHFVGGGLIVVGIILVTFLNQESASAAR